MAFINRDGAAGTLAAMKATNPAGHVPLAMTIAHQASTTAQAMGHVAVHADAGLAADTLDDAHVHLKHIVKHNAEGSDHHGRMLDSMAQRDPEVGAELEKLREATPGDDSFVPVPETDDHVATEEP